MSMFTLFITACYGYVCAYTFVDPPMPLYRCKHMAQAMIESHKQLGATSVEADCTLQDPEDSRFPT